MHVLKGLRLGDFSPSMGLAIKGGEGLVSKFSRTLKNPFPRLSFPLQPVTVLSLPLSCSSELPRRRCCCLRYLIGSVSFSTYSLFFFLEGLGLSYHGRRRHYLFARSVWVWVSPTATSGKGVGLFSTLGRYHVFLTWPRTDSIFLSSQGWTRMLSCSG